MSVTLSAARTVSRFGVSGPAVLAMEPAAGEKAAAGVATLEPSRGFPRGPPAGRRGLHELRRSGPCSRPRRNSMSVIEALYQIFSAHRADDLASKRSTRLKLHFLPE
ncbi:hypothetical protein NDU88_010136 [Pleurodeles waltl]|uniref:Uncharacterized protein n=1 Tax=Pleurodeles waltl TaxID=8319 RepID=A0AAV7S2D9_PLEWA|nr:hypothetical protein NDU88_010136 [Pleurodeles waltl]